VYTIYLDGEVLHAPTLAENGYVVSSPKLELEVNKAGSLTFTVTEQNPCYDKISLIKSIVTVYSENEIIFRGRVAETTMDFYRRKEVYCEGELAFLLDSVHRPEYESVTVTEWLSRVIRQHNAQVDSRRCFAFGKNTATEKSFGLSAADTEKIVYETTFDFISTNILDEFGGYLRTRGSEDTRYIDYLAEGSIESGQTIEFGKNLLDLSHVISADNVFTVLIPVGATTTEEKNGADQVSGTVTIASVNNGKDYIENEKAVKLFGRIWATEQWDDETSPSALYKKGLSYLNLHVSESVSLSLSAVDLSLLGAEYDRFRLGETVRVVSVPHGIDTTFTISGMSLDLENPGSSTYELGSPKAKLTESVLKQTKNKNIVLHG